MCPAMRHCLKVSLSSGDTPNKSVRFVTELSQEVAGEKREYRNCFWHHSLYRKPDVGHMCIKKDSCLLEAQREDP